MKFTPSWVYSQQQGFCMSPMKSANTYIKEEEVRTNEEIYLFHQNESNKTELHKKVVLKMMY